jgi:small subunit ribosomal protein S17
MIKKTKVGQVVSTKMDKTVVITVETPKRHPLYKKVIRTNKRYKAHDEKNECRLTDTVKIEECRPLSKEKRWRVVEVIVRGEALEYTPKQVTEATQVMPDKPVEEVMVEAAPEVEAVVEVEAAPEAEVEFEAEAAPEAEIEVEAEAAPEAEAEVVAEVEAEAEPEAEIETETEAVVDAADEPEAAPDAETESETK